MRQFPERRRLVANPIRRFVQLQKGDELVIWRLDRLIRSLKHIIDLVLRLSEAGIVIKGLTNGVDTSTMASLAEYERE
ncbi:recombinase family protein [Pedobacter sp. Leaf41]|uniref:recombinase family protein n=1 Tax=Pedobacter sp. Leaf41 TaxID=1736218 RepID=UPI0009E73002|nr:MAG: hypothetical protein EOO93_25630 [Pedobacter sp.]